MTTSRKKKKDKEPLKDERGYWVVGPFVTIVVLTKSEYAYPQTDPPSTLYGLDRDGQVWSFDPVKRHWSKVSHRRVDSPQPPAPPVTPWERRKTIEDIRKLQGPQAAAEFEADLRARGFEIADAVS